MITVTFADGCLLATASKSLWQYDYGQQLEIVGLDLPEAFQVDFCNSGDTATITVLGENNVVQIPEQFIADGRSITAFCFVYDETTGGTTKAEIKLPVLPRPERTDEQPDPEQEHVIDQLITKLGEDVEDAEAWAVGERDGEPVREDDPTYHNNAKYWSEKAKSDAPVTSVNGESGDVELNLDDIPNGETYARATPAQLAQIANNATDIADVKETADTALQPDDLEPYRTAAAQDAIDNGKQSKIIASGILKGDGNGGITAAVAGTDYVAPSALSAYRTASDQTAIDDAQDANITNNADDIDAINAKIPAQASANNKLADKSFVNSSIQTSSAHFRGNWQNWAAVPTNPNLYPVDDDGNHTPTSNDYMVIQDASDYPVQAGETALEGTWRFKYSGVWATNGRNGWHKEYQVNETPLTAAQLAAINSGATAELIAQISTNEEDISSINAKIPANASEANKLTDESRVNAIANAKLSFYRTAAAQDSIDAGKQAKITATGILKGDGAGGVSSAAAGTDYATPQQVNDKYTKPSSGIPSTDMTAAVQASLSKADTALQEVPDTYRTAADQDLIDDAQDERIADVEQTTTATTIGPASIVTFKASAADMPLKGLTVDIEPVQAEGTPSPENPLPITGLTGCKLHHTGVSLIGGDAFIGYTFAQNGEKYELSYNGSGIANRCSGYADISGIPAGRYVLQFLNCSYPEGIEVTFRRRTNGTLVTIGTIIGGATSGSRAFDIPANTTELQFYIVPNSAVAVGDKVTMDDAILYRSGETAEPYKGNTYDITFPSEAGAVYGGTLDVVNKKLTVDKIAYIATGTGSSAAGGMRFYKSSNTSRNEFYTLTSNNGVVVPSQTSPDKVICSHFKTAAPSNSAISCFVGSSQFRVVFPLGGDIETTTQMNDWVAEQYANGTPLTYVLTLLTPIVYDLADIPDVLTLISENNIWANRGDVTVTYGAYLETVKAYADQVGDSILSAIAPLETSYIATRGYAVGTYLFVGTKFFKVTSAIAEGGTITPGTNVVQTTVAMQLIAQSRDIATLFEMYNSLSNS